MTDNDIIRGIRENSSEAWRELYHSTVGGIRRKIEPMLKNVRHISFDDVFEEACITLMNHVKDGRVSECDGTNLSGYLFTICWRIALRQGNREKLPKEPEKAETRANGKIVIVEPNEKQQAAPEEAAEIEAEAMDFLDRVLKAIPEDCQKLLRRFYWDKMPMKDIAATMGLKNENVAKTKKNRCMDKFKDIAKAMLADDEKAEETVRRTIERDALRDLLEELRQEEAGDLAMAALKGKKD
jgi:RNA polymerase sigma factor (sigma-70 family)